MKIGGVIGLRRNQIVCHALPLMSPDEPDTGPESRAYFLLLKRHSPEKSGHS
jgi:hypothetical protein